MPPLHFSGYKLQIGDTHSTRKNADGVSFTLRVGATSPVRQMFNIVASLVAVALSAAPAAAQTQPPPPPPGLLAPIALVTDLSGNCLQPAGKSMEPGAAIVQEKCAGVAENVWILTDVGNGNFHLMNGLSGLCLDARGSAANGTPVQQWTCGQITNENWEFVGIAGSPNKTTLKSRVSGSSDFCLDVPGGNTAQGISMQIYRCNNTISQIWQDSPDQSTVVPNVIGKPDDLAANQIYYFGLTPYLAKSTSTSQCNASNAGIVVAELTQPGTVQAPKTGVTLIVCPPL